MAVHSRTLGDMFSTPSDFKDHIREHMLHSSGGGASSLLPSSRHERELALKEWFDPLAFAFDGEKLDVIFPHHYFSVWFQTRGKQIFEAALKEIMGRLPELCYRTPKAILSSTSPRAASSHIYSVQSPFREPLPRSADAFLFSPLSPLRASSSSFEAFIVGPKNKESVELLAHRCSSASPGLILLRGISGTGKTHLLHAAASLQLSSLHDYEHICCLNASLFSDIIRKQEENRSSFRDIFREATALYVDDVHMLSHDLKAQEALVSTLDLFHSAGRPIFLTASSDHGPDSSDRLAGLIPPLFSRMCMGLVLELNPPDIDVKMRYAQALLEEHSLPRNRDIALILARRCSDFRQIQGLASQIAAFHAFSGELPDEDVLDNIFRSSGKPRSINPDAVLAVVASRYGFTSKDLRGKKRDPKLVLARQIAMYLCRELLGESYPSLGRIFGNKDHSTVIHAVKKIRKTQLENKDMNIQLAELTQSCRRRFS